MAGYGGFWGGFWGGGVTTSELRVSSAEATTPQEVRVDFTVALDPLYLPNTDPSSYSIPGLTVTSVVLDGFSAVLQTSVHSGILYTVTVSTLVRSNAGIVINPAYRSATFFGLTGFEEVHARATGSLRIRLFCSAERLLLNAELLDPNSYQLLADHQTVVPIVSVLPEVSGNPYSVVLVPDSPLESTSWYTLILLSGALRTESGKLLYPDHITFQWVDTPATVSVPFDSFSGEVSGGILGEPDGVVFFSPALNIPVSGSVIQVDQVSVCTQAYDTYIPPVLVDPPPLYSFSPNLAISQLGLNNTVLWASPFRLGEATIVLQDLRSDTVPTAVDGRCVVEVKEPWDQTFVSLLNNPAWHLYDGNPTAFICANNLAPIPPGPDTTIVLVP